MQPLAEVAPYAVALFALVITMLAYAGIQVERRTARLATITAELQRKDRHLGLVAEMGPVHLFIATRDGSAEYVTSGFAALTGLDPTAVLGLGWLGAVHAEDRPVLEQTWRSRVTAGARVDADIRLRTAMGTHRWFKLRATATDEGDADAPWAGALIDIHDQYEADIMRADMLQHEQAARADAERAHGMKDDLLAAVSHELRTPLNAIIGWTHLLRANLDPQRAIEAIERNAYRQAQLIDDLIDVSRLVNGRLTLTLLPLDFWSAVRAAITMLAPSASAKGVQVQVIGRDDVWIHGDQARVRQVVWNLLSNAIKFTPTGGRVTVELSRDRDRAKLTVTDNGAGIDAALIGHVFDPLRQGTSRSTRAGLGLGLAIVKHIIELHGGTVDAESAGLQQGAVFAVILPISERPADAPAPVAAASRPALIGLRVLLVEDDEDSAEALEGVLTHRGCQVRTAHTAQECLEIVGGWHPDLLLCDIGLPDADGYALLRRVRERFTDPLHPIPAIALTALTRDEDRARALEAGFAAHVSKPYEPDRLVDEIVHAMATAT